MSPNLHLSDYGRVARQSVVAAETFEYAAFHAVGDKIVVLTMIHPELLSRLCRARDLLQDWDDEPLSITAIARVSGLTPFHFIRLFKATFGETPHQYRSRAQVEKAKHLLVLTNLSITEVCMAVGYSSLGSFSALFSRRVGMSPSEFQRRYRPGSAPERQLPASLIPGCLSLMTGIFGERAIFEKTARGRD